MGFICMGPTAVRRLGDNRLRKQRASEHYGLQYSIPYPHRIMRSARPVNSTPLYKKLSEKGAVFGQIGGWERAFWFNSEGISGAPGKDSYGHLSFRDDEPWRKAVKAECEAVQNRVGIMDHGGFTKFEVEGPGAEDYLDRLFCSKLPKPGRVRLSYLLTPKGRLLVGSNHRQARQQPIFVVWPNARGGSRLRLVKCTFAR